MHKKQLKSATTGFIVGDALGVPYEFKTRVQCLRKPCTGMIGYGTHNQPPGTWSDDSSMMLCLMESLCDGYSIEDIGQKFCAWLYNQKWTPDGTVFDVGITTQRALTKIQDGGSPFSSGLSHEMDNGNGSVMYILPLVFYLFGKEDIRKYKVVHEVSSITHAHIRSIIGCAWYVELGLQIINGKSLKKAALKAAEMTSRWYSSGAEELSHYSRLFSPDLSTLPEDEIYSDGYIVHTLEAVGWCLLTSSDYSESVLKAVNLGSDTDTVAALVGGIAGLYYGLDSIPPKWIETIARYDDIKLLIKKFNKTLK
jgi:ADP-ribosyl-[dinitrogen reductase] hydrolase